MKYEFIEIDERFTNPIIVFQQTEDEEKIKIRQHIENDIVEWKNRIAQYISDINAGTFKPEQVPTLLDDMIDKTFMLRAPQLARELNASVWGQSVDGDGYKEQPCDAYIKLRSLLPQITKQLAQHYKCKEKQILVGDYVKGKETKCDYVVILGDLKIDLNNNLRKAPKLKFVSGNVTIGPDEDDDCPKCRDKHRDCIEACYVNFLNMCDFNIEVIGGSLAINGCYVNFKSLRSIGESLHLNEFWAGKPYCEFNSLIRVGNSLTSNSLGTDELESNFNFPALKSIGGSLYASLYGLQNANIEYIGGDVEFLGTPKSHSNNIPSIRKTAKYIGGRIEFDFK